MRARSRFLLIVVLTSATHISAEIIWRGDFETGNTEQWKGAPKGEGVKVVTEPVREGKYALRIDGTNAAKRGKLDRIEFQHQPKPPGTAEGTERYFGWSVFVPKKFTDDFHSVGYFETRNSWRQLMAFEVHGEEIKYSTRVPYTLHWTGKGKLTPGVWHDFAVRVLWSRDAKKGFVEVWFDGEKVVPKTMTATLLDENPAFFRSASCATRSRCQRRSSSTMWSRRQHWRRLRRQSLPPRSPSDALSALRCYFNPSLPIR